MSILNGLNNVERSIGCIPSHLMRAKLPAKLRAPEQIEHRLVFHHLRRRHQDVENDPFLASVHHVMSMISQMKSLPFGGHDRRVGIGCAHAVIRNPPITAMRLFTVGASPFFNPVMAMSIGCGYVFSLSLRQRSRQQRWGLFLRGGFFSHLGALLFIFSRKQLRQMGFDCKTWCDGLHGSIGLHFGRIEIQILAPDQLGLAALFDNRFKKAPKDGQAKPLADASETGMVGQRLIQIIPDVPSHTQPICDLAHEQALGADIFKEHDQLQLEEHDWVNRRSSGSSIALANQIVDKREVQNFEQMAVKMVLGNQFLQRYRDLRGKRPLFQTHHDGCSSSSIARQPPTSCQPHLFPFSLNMLFFSFCARLSARAKRYAVKLMRSLISSARSFSTGCYIKCGCSGTENFYPFFN